MCGVFGVLSKEAVDFSRASFALEKIRHRGSDNSQSKILEGGRIFLGHQRLAILDLDDRANQPFTDGHNYLVYNGEIYNFKQLKKSGDYKTESDTEVLFKGLKDSGPQFLNSCEGMFAGAFFNSSQEKLILFRDGLGIKPLYYYFRDGDLIYSSEIKAITEYLSGRNFTLNDEVYESYITYENYNDKQTFFSEIQSLEKGEIVEFSTSQNVRILKRTFVEFNGQYEYESSDPIDNQIEILIKGSVAKHLVSDVPVAVYMSGGIDSTLVSSIAASQSSRPLTAFTGFFKTKDNYYDESQLAEKSAIKSNIQFEKVEIKPQHFIDNFDSLVYQLEQPRMGMGSFSQFIVSKEVAKEFKVVLSGHGGDELFGGYPLFLAALFMDKVSHLKTKFRILKSLDKKSLIWFSYALYKKVVTGQFLYAPRLNKTNSHCPSFESDKGSVEGLTNYYKSVYIPGLLSVEDKVSMLSSLETRMPLWTQSLVSFMEQVSSDQVFVDGTLKGLLKRVAIKYLPDEVVFAQKKGFPTPIRIWLKDELYDFVYSRIENSNCFSGTKSRAKLLRQFEGYKKGLLPFALDEKKAHLFWMFLNVDSWSRQFGTEVEWNL